MTEKIWLRTTCLLFMMMQKKVGKKLLSLAKKLGAVDNRKPTYFLAWAEVP
jgi:hypothetical protein